MLGSLDKHTHADCAAVEVASSLSALCPLKRTS